MQPVDWFLDLFRSKPAPSAHSAPEQELSPADFRDVREVIPPPPTLGWTSKQIQDMVAEHYAGTFVRSELFFHACRKNALIKSALNKRREAVQAFPWELRVPNEAPPEFHAFVKKLADDWQRVLPDNQRGEIIERTLFFGFCICRVHWEWCNGQKQPRFTVYTNNTASYRPDLWTYQVVAQDGLKIVQSDGREWVIFSMGSKRPHLEGLITAIAFLYFGEVVGDDNWIGYNQRVGTPIKKRITPMLKREQKEVQRVAEKDAMLRGGDLVLCPQDPETGRGYDFDYVQVNPQGYGTFKDQLTRFDELVAILILGHNLLQSVKGGSLAAMKEATGLLRIAGRADVTVLQTGFAFVAPVWARANFDQGSFEKNEEAWPEIEGDIDRYGFSLWYDLSDPEEKKEIAAGQQQFATTFKTMVDAMGDRFFDQPVDLVACLEKAGIPLVDDEASYAQDDTTLSHETTYAAPPALRRAASRSLKWHSQHRRGGSPDGRQLAYRILRGRLSAEDIVRMSHYFKRHESDSQGRHWNNLQAPSNARIAWGLWGDDGSGQGRAWVDKMAAEIKGALPAAEAQVLNERILLLETGE